MKTDTYYWEICKCNFKNYNFLLYFYFREDLEGVDDCASAKAYALATILKQFGAKSPQAVAILERCPTFVAKEKSLFRFLQRNKKVRSYFYFFNCITGHHMSNLKASVLKSIFYMFWFLLVLMEWRCSF